MEVVPRCNRLALAVVIYGTQGQGRRRRQIPDTEIIIKYNTSQRPQSFYYHIVSPSLLRSLIASAACAVGSSTDSLPESATSSPSEGLCGSIVIRALQDGADYCLLFGNC